MTLIGFVLGLFPGLAWLIFYLQEDEHPEPKRLIALVFLCGALSAVLAFFLELAINGQFAKIGIESFSIVSLIVLAFIEEIIKFGAAYLAIHKNPEFNEPIDAMIYTMVAALGFATIENLGALTGQPGQSPLFTAIFETTSFRFVGATLLHAVTSSLVGYYWALKIRNFNTGKFLRQGILLATILHTVFNYLIIHYANLIYAVSFVVIIGFFTLIDFEKLKGERV